MPTTQAKQALRASRKAAGLCIHCGKAADRGTRCSACAERDADNRKRYLARDRAAGVCISLGCRRKARPNRVTCNRCARKQADDARKRKRRGVCQKCSNTAHAGGYCKACRKKRARYMRKWRLRRIKAGRCPTCPDNILAVGYRRCETCLSQRRAAHNRLKKEVLAAYGGPVCVGCGEDEILILQIDHIAGGGSKHGKEIGGRGRLYKWLKDHKFPDGYRVLCPNCNMRAARGLPLPATKTRPAGGRTPGRLPGG